MGPTQEETGTQDWIASPVPVAMPKVQGGENEAITMCHSAPEFVLVPVQEQARTAVSPWEPAGETSFTHSP